MKTAIRRSPAARLLATAGAVSVEEAGWEVAASFGDDAAERDAIRDAIAIADVTPRGKVDVRGDVAGAVLGSAGAVVARISDGWALVLGRPGDETRLLPAIEAVAGPAAMVSDATHLHAGVAIAGPAIPELLARTTSWDGDRLGRGEAAAAPIAEVPALILRRDLDLDVLELYVASELGRYAWETLAGVVERLGGRPVGWQALRAEGWS